MGKESRAQILANNINTGSSEEGGQDLTEGQQDHQINSG